MRERASGVDREVRNVPPPVVLVMPEFELDDDPVEQVSATEPDAATRPESSETVGPPTGLPLGSSSLDLDLRLTMGIPVTDELQGEAGEYYVPYETSFHQQEGRNRFLWLACQHNPRIAASLNGPLLELLVRFEDGRIYGGFTDMLRPPSRELSASIERWCREWGLVGAWVPRQIWAALYARRVEEGRGRSWPVEEVWRPTETLKYERRLDVPAFSFQHQGWQPTRQKKGDARKEIERAFKQQLTIYLDGIANLAESSGLKKVPQPRLRAPKPRSRGPQEVPREHVSPDRHIEWLVRWRVPDPETDRPWSKKKLAREYGVSWATIKDALERTAELLDAGP